MLGRWERWEDSELGRWERWKGNKVGRWANSEAAGSERLEGSDVASWESWVWCGRVVRWQARKGGRVVKWQGGRFLVPGFT